MVPPILGKMGGQGVAGVRDATPCLTGWPGPWVQGLANIQSDAKDLALAEAESLAKAAINGLRRHEAP